MQRKLNFGEEDAYYFYYKNKEKKIEPVRNKDLNEKAKLLLKKIYEEHKDSIPEKFIINWSEVKLFHPKGNILEAHALILELTEGSYDIHNELNHLTGKSWTKFTCSWFLFNALKQDLNEEKSICKQCEDHPATYSPTMMEEFISFFTKEKMSVLDPFLGIGSTLVGCKRTNRIGYGVEINKKYYEIAIKRTPEFKKNIYNGDARNINKIFEDKKFNFCISSPPYWNVLNRSTADFKKLRNEKNLDVRYSELKNDLGNIDEYGKFLSDLSKIYLDIYDLLYDKSYIVIIVKNIKKGGVMYPLAWDLAKILSTKYVLKDERIWIQDKISLAPFGYPKVWASNILHHYCIILRKEENINKSI